MEYNKYKHLFGNMKIVNYKKERELNKNRYPYTMYPNDHWSKARTHFGSNSIYIFVTTKYLYTYIYILLKRKYKYFLFSYAPYADSVGNECVYHECVYHGSSPKFLFNFPNIEKRLIYTFNGNKF